MDMGFQKIFIKASQKTIGATVFSYYVTDPSQWGHQS